MQAPNILINCEQLMTLSDLLLQDSINQIMSID